MDEYLEAFGVNKIVRSIASLSKPRLIINENNGKWTIITDNGLRSNAIKFIPGSEYETTLTTDGREVKGVVNFENDKWVESIYDEEGKQTIVTRWIDNNDQHNVVSSFYKFAFINYSFSILDLGSWRYQSESTF